MTTTMPADGQNQAINVLGLNPGKCHQVPFTTSEANTSPQISETISVISVFFNKRLFLFKLEASDVTCTTSNGHFLPASTFLDLSLGGGALVREFDKFICVIRRQ